MSAFLFSVDVVLWTFLREFVHAMCPLLHAWVGVLRAGGLGEVDAFLSGEAQFALFVFNDASREADSRRVERAVFDVSDYDITDVQRRRAEEWGSVLSLYFFFLSLSHPSGTLFRKKGGSDRQRRRGKDSIFGQRTRMLFFFFL